jgi:hypothetical protein
LSENIRPDFHRQTTQTRIILSASLVFVRIQSKAIHPRKVRRLAHFLFRHQKSSRKGAKTQRRKEKEGEDKKDIL